MTYNPLIPLETFRENIAYHPFHFWQLATNSKGLVPVTSACNTVVREYAWQNAQAAGRADIRRAIFTAEQRLEEYLQYPPQKRFYSEELDLNCQGDQHMLFPLSVTLEHGRIIRIASEVWTFSQDVAPVYSSVFGGGLEDTFTLTFVDNTTTDLADIGVYFTTDDRFPIDQDYLARWRIEPVVVTRKDANTVQVQGKKWLVVRPQLYQNYGTPPGINYNDFGIDSSGAIDPMNAASFVTALSIYVRSISNPDQATLVFDNCGTETTTALCAVPLDKDAGIVQLTTGANTSLPCWCSYYNWWWGYYGQGCGCSYNPVQRLRIDYEAGENIATLIQDWKTTIVRLAIAELMQPINACEQSNLEIKRWQQNMAYRGSPTEIFDVDRGDLGNPLGTRAGHLYAWKRIKNLRRATGLFIG
jgi:hypothetical protein